MTEAHVLSILRNRYSQGQIYTRIGSVLVNINPYTPLPLYSQSLISRITSGSNSLAEPHIYQVAFAALSALLDSGKSQSILITGESGSGKTEAAKHCLRLLAETAGSELAAEGKILLATPLLEALGNAKTVRNENSSRVGKWTEVAFGSNGEIIGAEIKNFLLEKTRVVHQAKGERNFRIFYQLMAHKAVLPELSLDLCEQWRYLNPVPLRADQETQGFTDVQQAAVGLSIGSWKDYLAVLAAILHIGNLRFQVGEKGCEIERNAHFAAVCRLLGVTEELLQQTLCYKTLCLAKETIHKAYTPPQAQEAADNLSKSLYVSLFLHLLDSINSQLTACAPSTASIGVLDIYGFEILPCNSFEQLCINYANEKLQQYFVQCLFKEEEDVYETEGVEFDPVAFPDNLPILALIEGGKGSLLYLINDEITLQRGSDEALLRRFYGEGERNEAFKSEFRSNSQFLVRHYSGEVTYDISGFLAKSKDQLSEDLLALLSSSTVPFLPATASTHMHESKKSIGIQFKEELDALLGSLADFAPHFVRCIKPNSLCQPLGFEGALVLHQLRCLGLVEAGKILQTGFPFKVEHREFVRRYRGIGPAVRAPNPKALCKRLVEAVAEAEAGFRVGKTMVLFGFRQHRALERLRNVAIEKTVLRIQTRYRQYKARKLLKELKTALPDIQAGLTLRNIDQIKAILLQYAHLQFEMRSYVQLKALCREIEGQQQIDADFQLVLSRQGSPEAKIEELEALLAQAGQLTYQSVCLSQAQELLSRGNSIRSARIALTRLLENSLSPWELKATLSAIRGKGLEQYLAGLFETAEAAVQRSERETGFRQFLLTALETGALKAIPPDEDFKLALKQLKSALDKANLPFQDPQTETVFQAVQLLYNFRQAALSQNWTQLETLLKEVSSNSLLREVQDLAVARQTLAERVSGAELLSRLQAAVTAKEISTVEMVWKQVSAMQLPVSVALQSSVKTLLDWLDSLETRIEQCGSDPALIDIILSDCAAKKIDTPAVGKLRAKKAALAGFEQAAALALNLLNLPLMRQTLQIARQLDFTAHPLVAEINRLLYEVNEITLVRWQYDVAVKVGDKALMLERLLALRDLQWRANSSAYEWTRYPRLRTPEDWAAKKWVGRDNLARGMLRHSKHLLPQSLSVLRSTKLEKQAVDLFKSLLTIMGDRIAHNDLVGEVLDVLLAGLRSKEIREELYLQVMKQLTGNEDGASERKGWEVLSLCLRCFSHPALDCYLHSFIRTESPDSENLLRLMYAAQIQPIATEPTREWVASHLKLSWTTGFPSVTYSPQTHPELTNYTPRVRDF